MTTPAQGTGGKGKKKNKEGMKVSIDEFNQIDAPLGHSVVNVKVTGLDWAATMANYDEQSAETQQIIVPSAPRSHRGPDVDLDSLPNEPPFRVSLFNLPLSTEDKDITDRFFTKLAIKGIETLKTSTTVEFEGKNDLYEALCKDGTSFKNKTINVCLFGQQPQESRYGGYGGRGGGGFGDRYGDRYDSRFRERRNDGFGQARNDRYGDRPSYNRDSYDNRGPGRLFSGSSTGVRSSGGYNDRYDERGNSRDRDIRSNYSPIITEQPEREEPSNWRDRPAPQPASEPAPSNSTPYVRNFNRDRMNRSNYSPHNAPEQQHSSQPPEPENWRDRPAPSVSQPAPPYARNYRNRVNRSNFSSNVTEYPVREEPDNWRARPDQTPNQPQPDNARP